MKTIAIVQARMGSHRLPGKILKTIGDKSIVEHTLTNLQQCKKIDKIYLATGSGEENKPLLQITQKLNVPLFFGSEDNVLKRFWDVLEREKSQQNHYDQIVRICADSPFIDSIEVDKLILAHQKKNADLSTNYNHATGLPCGFGVEVITYKAFKESYQLARTNEHREHLDEWILQHPTKYKIYSHPVPKLKQSYRLHFTVDYPEDLTFLQNVATYLQQQNIPLTSQHILNATKKNPSLPLSRKMNLFVRCDGSGEIGMGHIMRTLTICNALKQQIPSLNITYYTNQEAQQFIQNQGYQTKIYLDDLIRHDLKDINPDMILIDLRKHIDDASSEPLSRALRIRLIDSESSRVIRADLIINSYPQKNFQTQSTYLAGLNYLPLQPQFTTIEKKDVSKTPKEVLVMLGGGNLHTPQLLQLCNTIKSFPKLHFTIITGAAMDQKNQTKINQSYQSFPHVQLLQNVDNIHTYMQNADLAISGAGNTLFEFARCGVPTISISTDYDLTHSSHQEHYAKVFEQAGTSLYLGHNTNWTNEQLHTHLNTLLQNQKLRTKMSTTAQKLIDGKATERICKIILKEYVQG